MASLLAVKEFRGYV